MNGIIESKLTLLFSSILLASPRLVFLLYSLLDPTAVQPYGQTESIRIRLAQVPSPSVTVLWSFRPSNIPACSPRHCLFPSFLGSPNRYTRASNFRSLIVTSRIDCSNFEIPPNMRYIWRKMQFPEESNKKWLIINSYFRIDHQLINWSMIYLIHFKVRVLRARRICVLVYVNSEKVMTMMMSTMILKRRLIRGEKRCMNVLYERWIYRVDAYERCHDWHPAMAELLVGWIDVTVGRYADDRPVTLAAELCFYRGLT